MKYLGSKQRGGQYEECDYELMRTFSKQNTSGNNEGGYVYKIAISDDGKKFMSVSNYDVAKVWNVETGEELYTMSIGTVNSNIAMFANDKRVVFGSGDDHEKGIVKIWDLETRKVLHSFKGHADYVRSVAVFPDNSKIVSASKDGTINIWNANTGELKHTFNANIELNAVAVFPDGSKIVAGGMGSPTYPVKVWDVVSGEVRIFEGHTSYIVAVAVFPDGSKIATGDNDRNVKIWDIESGRELRTLPIDDSFGFFEILAVFPDGSKILSGTDEGDMIIWDVVSGKKLHTFSLEVDELGVFAVSADCRIILSGGRTVTIWEENKMVLTRKASDIVDKIGLNDDIIRMIKDKLPTYCSELNRLQK